jgi:LacI family transcriptional regulator
VVLCNADNNPAKEASYLVDLRSFRVAGLLIIPAAGSDLASGLVGGTPGGPPVVCLDRCPEGWTGDAVLVANELGAYHATKHLIQSGHRNLAVIAGPAQLPNAVERLNGFKKACREAHLLVAPEFIQYAAFDTRSGFHAAKRLLRMLPRPTGIFACNDLMALGVLHAAHEQGLRCPEDFSLVGFDSLEFCEYTSPALTSVYQPGYQLGATAAGLLLERIKGLSEASKRILLETELKIRSSVLPLARAAAPPAKTPRTPRNIGRKVLATG